MTEPLGTLVQKIASLDNLSAAYSWLMSRQRGYYDSWLTLFAQGEEGVTKETQRSLLSGTFKLDSITEFRWDVDGTTHKGWSWEAADALVLRAVAQILTPYLKNKLGLNAKHLKGCGGAKDAIRIAAKQLPQFNYVLRTDVQDYYQSMDHAILRRQISAAIDDPVVIALLDQYLDSSVYYGGVWNRRWGKGISTGCPLAPLLGALYLHPLDQSFALKSDKFFYIRFMDDILILTKTRWHLKEAVAKLNCTFETLKQHKHPDKTFIGAIARGFDFLGYCYKNGIWEIAAKTIEQCTKKITRLLEQDYTPKIVSNSRIPGVTKVAPASRPPSGSGSGGVTKLVRVRDYIVRFMQWATSGLSGRINLSPPSFLLIGYSA